MTCKEFKALKCRFCLVLLPFEKEDLEGPVKVVCEAAECNAKLASICDKIRPGCKHPCQGFKGEK